MERKNFECQSRKRTRKFDPKEAGEKRWQDRLPWLKWRWEFRRRDPGYQAAWREAQVFRKKGDPEGKSERDLAEGFELFGGVMIDPNTSFDELLETSGRRWVTETFIDPEFEKALKIVATWQQSQPIPGALFKWAFLIDFTKFNSITSLKEDVARWVDECWEFTETKEARSKTKQNAKDFERILKVGLLKEKKKTFPQIADEIDYRTKGEWEAGTASMTKRAQQDFRWYQELTEGGGWRNLTYP